MSEVTTRDIEKTLMHRLRAEMRCSPVAPSLVLPHGWEADVAAASKTCLIHEFEIKVSRSDFQADFRKNGYHGGITKHQRMAQRLHDKVIPGVNNDMYIARGWPLPKYWTPNYFWFCSPIGILKEDDIPEYSGWMEFGVIPWLSYRKIELLERKKAPRLHKEKLYNDRMKDRFLSRLTNIVAFGRGSES